MKGLIAWFTRNGVASNILMIAIVAAGIYSLRERVLFRERPEYPARNINITVPYRGATPEEAEESIVIRIEDAIYDVPGIREMRGSASESGGSVSITVEDSFDMMEVYNEVQTRVDGINTFPTETERPRISMSQHQERLITVVLSGKLSELDLKRLGEQVRDELSSLPGVTLANLKVVRPYEVSVEVSEETLKEYGITLNEVANAIRSSSINLSAGNVRTEGGDVLLRTQAQAYRQDDFEEIVVMTRDDGTRILLKDIADIKDGFDEVPIISRHNGKRAVIVDVYRSGNQSALELGEIVRKYVDRRSQTMPEGVHMQYWRDDSDRIKQRLDTLVGSAITGFLLVLFVLSLFLRPSLALWVSLGIPIAFAGTFFVMPLMGVSINLITLFAFILVLGIIVDDAIVTGENVFHRMQQGMPAEEAAIKGTQEVAVPVTFGVLTTMVAFYPLMVMTGWQGNLFKQIPMVVIPVLFFSLIESKLILPSHLKHCTHVGKGQRKKLNFLLKMQRFVADGLEHFVVKVYRPILNLLLRHRYTTLAGFVAVLIVFIALVVSNRISYHQWPNVPRDDLRILLTMPNGTPFEETQRHINRIEKEALAVRDEVNAEFGETVITDVFATTGGHPFGGWWGGRQTGVAERGEVVIELTPAEVRESDFSSMELAQRLRGRVGTIPGAESFTLSYARDGGESIEITLRSSSFDDLQKASLMLQDKFASYAGLTDIEDTFESSKDEFELVLKPQAEILGLRSSDLARQVRQAFYGAEAQRIPRDGEDVRVIVRYPLEQRRTLATLDTMMIRTPNGNEVPFVSVAKIIPGKSLPTIQRVDRKRRITVSAKADPEKVDLEGIRFELTNEVVPEIIAQFPGMESYLSGWERDQRDNMNLFFKGVGMVLIGLFILLAIPFRSYLQPFIVMSVIPFGIIGSVMGHVIMGESLSFMSLLGMLALAGIVVNDSLVMVDYINTKTGQGMVIEKAVRRAGERRFRPILLTSLTTFAGLLPLMFETSRQARFMVPMAISLAWGVAFGTVITLLLIPVNTLILEDIKNFFRKVYGIEKKPISEEEQAGDSLMVP